MTEIRPLFTEILPDDSILSEPHELESFGTDTARNFSGRASLVLLPRTTEQVQQVIQRCNEHKLAIIPSGGRTGLCGAATATSGELVLSLQRMNKILEIQPDDRMVKVQAGITTLQLKEALSEFDLDFPISLASMGSSQIGGNINTNAGGIHFIRYGPTRNWVLGLTAVTGRGEILSTGRAIHKDNTGYDLRALFIGSEGTLGVITEATLCVAEKPEGLTRILCALPKIADAIPLLSEVRREFHNLSAFEFFTDRALNHVTHFRKLINPFEETYPCYVLVELEARPEEVEESVSAFFMNLLEQELVLDVVIAQNSKQSEEIMNLREWISETMSAEFTPHKNDVSVPVSKIPGFVTELEKLMATQAPEYELVLFGHVGDGNIHLNWLKPDGESREDFFQRSKLIDKQVQKLVSSFGGSVSAEHGIGLLKKEVLPFSRSELELEYMRSIKRVFDPNGILNPGKIFD